jgi:hypothetical protein
MSLKKRMIEGIIDLFFFLVYQQIIFQGKIISNLLIENPTLTYLFTII